MRPPFRYYGSKVRMAPLITSMMDAYPHQVYVEPFAGSLSVLFAKRPVRHEIVNDLSSDVVRFLRVLREQPDDLARACRMTPHARAEFESALMPPADASELELARLFWVRVNQGFNGLPNRAGWSVSVRQNTSRPRASANIADRLLECAERLRYVTIEHKPAVEVIDRFGVPGAVIYCDPTYVESTRSDRRKRPSGDYDHEMSDTDHAELAHALRATAATVFLSGYPCELYEELYAGWSTHSITVDRTTTRGTATGLSSAIETIWSNRPIALYGTGGGSSMMLFEFEEAA